MCHMSGVRCLVSGVRCHMSHVKCPFFCFVFSFFLQSDEASQWSVCYQWGLPRLVLQVVGDAKFRWYPKKLDWVGPVDNRPSGN